MSKVEIVEDSAGYGFGTALQRARQRSAYWEEELLLTVARRISDTMADQDVSRSELARRLGVSPAYVTKLLRGHANMTIETLAKIAFALGHRWECLPVGLDETVTVFGAASVDGSCRVGPAGIETPRDREADAELPKEKKNSETVMAAKPAVALKHGLKLKPEPVPASR